MPWAGYWITKGKFSLFIELKVVGQLMGVWSVECYWVGPGLGTGEILINYHVFTRGKYKSSSSTLKQ